MSGPNIDRRFFVDTNVLLYALDTGDPARHEQARRWMAVLWESGAGRISWQVLNEYYSNARKVKAAMAVARLAQALVEREEAPQAVRARGFFLRRAVGLLGALPG